MGGVLFGEDMNRPVETDVVRSLHPSQEVPIQEPPFTFIRKVSGGLLKVYFGDSPEAVALNAPINNGELLK